MAKYILTKKAEDDIQNIFEYGIAQFGIEQALEYLNELEEILELLALKPKLARVRKELNHQTRAHPFYSHVILYKEFNNTALILSIRSARENWLKTRIKNKL